MANNTYNSPGAHAMGMSRPEPTHQYVRTEWEIQEVLDWLFNDLQPGEKITFFNAPWEDLIRFHHGYGTYIRNTFGLWAKHPLLLASMCLPLDNHPDDTSYRITVKLWESVRK